MNFNKGLTYRILIKSVKPFMGYTVTSTNTAACNLGPPPPPPNGILGKVLSYRISSKSDYGFTYTKKFTYEEELNQVFLMRQLA